MAYVEGGPVTRLVTKAEISDLVTERLAAMDAELDDLAQRLRELRYETYPPASPGGYPRRIR